MSDKVREFLPGGAHVSTTGFTNYLGGGGTPTPEDVWREFPGAIIIDGADDWYADEKRRPQALVFKAEVPVLAWFHTGISGITRSGAVLAPAEFERFARWYATTYGCPPETHLTVHRPRD